MKIDGNKRVQRRRILRGIPFFASLSEKELESLEEAVVDKRFAKDETILFEEDTLKYMYIVFSGRVKAVQGGKDGKEHILAIHRRGEFFGEMALLDGKTSPAAVIAMEASEVGLIAKPDFEKYLMTSTKALQGMISLLCSRLRESWLTVKVLNFTEAEHRIHAVLSLISRQYGVKESRGTMIGMRLTHRDIADYASLSRETITRCLNRLSESGEIEVLENRQILLKPSFFKKAQIL